MPSPQHLPSKRYRPHVPLDKRKRAIRACLSCRGSKKKCVLTSRDQCQECTRYGLACTFEPVKDRGNHLYKDPSRLHSSTVWDQVEVDVSRSLQERFPGINLNSEQFSILSNLFREAVMEKYPLLFPETDSCVGPASTARDQVPHPRVVVEPEVSNLPARSVVENTPSASHASFLAAVSETIPPVCLKDQDDRLHMSSHTQEEDAALISSIIDQLPPLEVAEALVSVFFTFLETNWYYFDKKTFRYLFVQLYADRASAQQLRCTHVCQVLMVLAMASTFKHLVEPFQLVQADQDIPGSKLFAHATRLMPGVIAANSVESVICSLLMSLYLLATDDIEHHHIYLGLALNQAVGLSMHRAGADSDETPEAQEVKVRVFWTVYCIERLTSGVMGLPTMLQVKDISAPLPQKRQDLDGDNCHEVDRLVAITQLTMGMDEIVNAGPIEKGARTYEWALSKMASLKPPVPVGISESLAPSFRGDAHLQMLYHMLWVNLGRGATLRLVRQLLHPPSSLGNQEAYLRSQELVERCKEAATIILDWISQLHHRGLLAKFSFTDFHTCSSAVIVLLLYSILHPAHGSLPVTQGINALQFMAEGSRLAMNALRLIERLRESIHKYIDVGISESVIDQRSVSQMALGQDLSPNQNQTSNVAENIPQVSTGNNEPTVVPGDIILFPDLEPWLLEYSDQYLTLFGFDGFGSVFEPNSSQT